MITTTTHHTKLYNTQTLIGHYHTFKLVTTNNYELSQSVSMSVTLTERTIIATDHYIVTHELTSC